MSYQSSLKLSKTLSMLNVALGAWYFICPWVLGFSQHPNNPWSNWLTGSGIIIIALVQLSDLTELRFLGFIDAAVGAFVFASPWIFNYLDRTGRAANSLCVGAVVFLVGVTSTRGRGRPGPHAIPPLSV